MQDDTHIMERTRAAWSALLDRDFDLHEVVTMVSAYDTITINGGGNDWDEIMHGQESDTPPAALDAPGPDEGNQEAVHKALMDANEYVFDEGRHIAHADGAGIAMAVMLMDAIVWIATSAGTLTLTVHHPETANRLEDEMHRVRSRKVDSGDMLRGSVETLSRLFARKAN